MKKVLKVLWKTSIMALSITALLSFTVFAKATKIDVTGKDGKFYDYNLDALKASAVAAAINGSADPGAKLYENFLANKATVRGFYDDVKNAYVDYATVVQAAKDAAVSGHPFSLDKYLESPTTTTIALTPSDVTASADGNVAVVPPASTPAIQTPSNPSYRLPDSRDTVPVKPAVVSVSNASAVNLSTIKVTFNVNVTDAISAKLNYTLSKGTVVSAAKTGDREVTLTVSGLTYQDTTNLNLVSPAYSKEVKMPSVSDLYTLVINSENGDTIKADGTSQTTLYAIIVDKATGSNLVENADVAFAAAEGTLSQQHVVMQNGEASVQLTSTSSAISVASTVTANVASSEYAGLTAQKTIYFYPVDYDVSTVSNITVDKVKVEMTTAPAIADAAKFIVLNGNGSLVNNQVIHVEKDTSDQNGKTYILTLTNSLDGTEGNLSVNGKEPVAKAYDLCDWEYDFIKPELVSATYNKTAGTLALQFSKLVSLQDTDINEAEISVDGTPLTENAYTYTEGQDKSRQVILNVSGGLTGQLNVEIKEGAFKDPAGNLSKAGSVTAVVNN